MLIFFRLATSDCAIAVDRSFSWCCWKEKYEIYRVSQKKVGSQKTSNCSNSLNFEAKIKCNTIKPNVPKWRKTCTGLKFDLLDFYGPQSNIHTFWDPTFFWLTLYLLLKVCFIFHRSQLLSCFRKNPQINEVFLRSCNGIQVIFWRCSQFKLKLLHLH